MRKLSTLRDAATGALAVTPGCPEVTVHERRIHTKAAAAFRLQPRRRSPERGHHRGTKAQLLDWATRQRAAWGCGR